MKAMPAPATTMASQGRQGQGDQHIGHRGEHDGHHEKGEHAAPAQAGPPQRRAALAHATEHVTALEHRQHHQQAQHGEKAAPEGHLKFLRVFKVARDDTGG
jgi:hypothetical protein